MYEYVLGTRLYFTVNRELVYMYWCVKKWVSLYGIALRICESTIYYCRTASPILRGKPKSGLGIRTLENREREEEEE